MHKSDDYSDERREHRRVIFTADENITGKFLVPGIGKTPINALILNISMGGLYFTPEKGKNPDIKNGDRLVFMHLNIPESDPLVLNIDAEIKWIMDAAMLEYIGIGCLFIKLSDSSSLRLDSYINKIINMSKP